MPKPECCDCVIQANTSMEQLRLIKANVLTRRLFRLPKDYIGMTISDLFGDRYIKMFQTLFVQANGTPTIYRFAIVSPNGAFWLIHCTCRGYLLHLRATKATFEDFWSGSLQQRLRKMPLATYLDSKIGDMILHCTSSKIHLYSVSHSLARKLDLTTGNTLEDFLQNCLELRHRSLFLGVQRSGQATCILCHYQKKTQLKHLLLILEPHYQSRERLLISVHLLTQHTFYALASHQIPRLSKDDSLQPSPIDELAASLTPREQQITSMLVEGLPIKEIASELSIAEGTVKKTSNNIYRKMNISSRTELMHLFYTETPETLLRRMNRP